MPWEGSARAGVVSPDGRLAVVWIWDGDDTRPVLYRLSDPPGPIAELTPLLSGFPQEAAWAPDSKRLLFLGAVERYADRFELSLFDLEQKRVTARWPVATPSTRPGALGFVGGTDRVFAVFQGELRSYQPATGRELEPRIQVSSDPSACSHAPLIAFSSRADDRDAFKVVSLRDGRTLAELPLAQPSVLSWSESEQALAVLGSEELVIYRPARPLVRAPVGKEISRDALVWGQGAHTLALVRQFVERCAGCVRPDPESVRVFSADTGQPLDSHAFAGESPAWRLTVGEHRLAYDHPVEPRRIPLPGVPFFRSISHVMSWLDEQHVILDWGEQLDFELTTGRVVRSGRNLVQETAGGDELLSCESGRYQRLRAADGARLGSLPLPGCPPSVERFDAYFSRAEASKLTIAELSSGKTVTTFDGFLVRSPPGKHAVALLARNREAVSCGRFDYGSARVSRLLELPSSIPDPGCGIVADAVFAAWRDADQRDHGVIWRPAADGYVDRAGKESRKRTDFCRGRVEANENALVCVELAKEKTRVITYDGRVAEQELPGRAQISALAPDGGAVAVVTEAGAAQLLRLGATRRKSELMPAKVESLHFSPSGKRLVLIADRTYVYDLASEELHAWGEPGAAHATVFRADERTLVLPAGPSDRNVSVLVRDGVALARGENLLETDRFVLLRTETGAVELWSRTGERQGALPRQVNRGLMLSPSGKLGLWFDHDTLKLVRVGSPDVLGVRLLWQFDKYYGVLAARDGRFSGDDGAFEALRFASGSSLASALPLTGLDVRASFEYPALFREFASGTLAPRGTP